MKWGNRAVCDLRGYQSGYDASDDKGSDLFIYRNTRSYTLQYRDLTFYCVVVESRTTKRQIQQSFFVHTQRIFMFCMDMRTNSDYFPIQH